MPQIDTDGAVTFLGSGHVASKNRVKDSRDEGFVIVATDCVIEENRFNGVEDDALDLEGDGNVLRSNRVKEAGSNGVELSPADGEPFAVTGNLLEKNRITKSDDNGFFVGTAGNTLIGNKAKQSGVFDLFDQAGPGANTCEDNVFGTEHFE